MIHLGTEATMEALPGVKGPFLTAPIGFAGIHAVYAATALGYKHQFLFGYDFSFEDSHHAFPQPLNDNDESIEVTITEGGKVYRTTDAMAHAANHFRMAITPLIQTCDIDIRMMSDGLLPDIIHQCQDTLESEQKKYEEIWQKPVYSEKSPAMEWVEEAVDLLGVEYGDSISDFGCGTGRSVRWMIDQGFDAVGVDITPAGLDQEIPFVQAALWESDKLPQTKYGFSTDVMEHIPRDKIRETLRAIHDSCSVGCYLNIDTLPDHLGQLIGKPLHLTVMEYSKWEALLKEFWPNVSGRPEGRQAIFVCRR
jgi:hypothetical protein